MKYKQVINQMTLEEKAKMCVGKDYWNSFNIDRLKIPSITMSDGPNGLRIQRQNGDNLGINESEISICFPTGATVANSWDRELAYLYGKTLGQEAKCENINMVLGPAINIKRSPLCGRNFEYYSEDPYLTAILGNEYVKGLQENGVGACVKHFAINNQENRRRTIDVLIDERAMREIYLKAFEFIVKNSKPWAIMTAYNKVNGKYCSENERLLKILQKEWNFEGITITDWGANNNRVQGLKAGNELEMPGGRGNGAKEIVEAVVKGEISEEYLNNIVDKIIDISIKCEERKITDYNKGGHHEIALKLAEESIVLLKNDENILPMKRKNSIAVIGDMAKNPRYQGAGSSTINCYKLEKALDNLKQRHIEVDYAKGYERVECIDDEELLKEAIEVAKRNEVVLIFAGLTENYESEGMDRQNIQLPKNQNRLITEVCKINHNVVVILSHGSVIDMPWREDVKAIITGYLGGEAGGKAIVNTLLGDNNPSGKLAETYPMALEQTPCYDYFPGNEVNVAYKESIYVGYRYYDKKKLNVAFPFGYGLSYTSFEYSDLKINKEKDKWNISLKIKNVGSCPGKEVVQVYIKKEKSKIYRADKELKAFEKVALDQGEEKKIEITLDKTAFEYYDVGLNRWNIESGEYTILIGKSSRNIVFQHKIMIDTDDNISKYKIPEKYYLGDVEHITDEEYEKLLGYAIPNKEIVLEDITDENTIEQLKNTKVGKIIFDSEMVRMKNLLNKQNVNKATKVMMDLQKPLKKFYEKQNGKFTREMVDKFIKMAKNNDEPNNCEFINIYLNI